VTDDLPNPADPAPPDETTPPADATAPAWPAPDAMDATAPMDTPAATAPPQPVAPAYPAPPPIAPPATPTPPVGWQAPPVVVATKGQRTGLAMAAGILLILGGIGGILLGLLVAIVGGSVVSSLDFSQFNNSPDLNGANAGALAGGVVAFFGAVVVAYSIAYLIAGVGVLRNSNWARVLGIILGVISGLIWLSGFANANNAQGTAGAAGGGLFSLVALGVHVFIVVVLLFFWRTKPTAVA
jgi:uncharacterized membrane protein (DUF2068 family)